MLFWGGFIGTTGLPANVYTPVKLTLPESNIIDYQPTTSGCLIVCASGRVYASGYGILSGTFNEFDYNAAFQPIGATSISGGFVLSHGSPERTAYVLAKNFTPILRTISASPMTNSTTITDETGIRFSAYLRADSTLDISDRTSAAVNEDGTSMISGLTTTTDGLGRVEIFERNAVGDYTPSDTVKSCTPEFLRSVKDSNKDKRTSFGQSVSLTGAIGHRWAAVGAPEAYDGKGFVWVWRIDERDSRSPDSYIIMGDRLAAGFGSKVRIFTDDSTGTMMLNVKDKNGRTAAYARTGPRTSPFVRV